MIPKKINDIINTEDIRYKHKANLIVANFESTLDREKPIKEEQRRNLKKLAALFLVPFYENEPVVVGLDIGEGKSSLILQFLKYIHETDDTILEKGIVVVKKTIKEGKQFCKDLGLREGFLQDNLNEPNEEDYIGRLVRSFNKGDCVKHFDNFGLWGETDSIEYSRDICRNCKEDCAVKDSKNDAKKHPVIVMTHQRLFISNDFNGILDIAKKKEMLIIDEKLPTIEIGKFKHSNMVKVIDKLKASSEGFPSQIEEYFENLETGCTKFNEPYSDEFAFNSEAYGVMLDDADKLETLGKIQKFMQNGGYVINSFRNDREKEFHYVRHIKLSEYTRCFMKIIILDATSYYGNEILDMDYKNSGAVYLDGIKKLKNKKINLYNIPVKTTKYSFVMDSNKEGFGSSDYSSNIRKSSIPFYKKRMDFLSKEVANIITATNKKTLVVCYRDILAVDYVKFPFKEDLRVSLKKLLIGYEVTYKIRHFGESITGINNFRKFENIILIGFLDKGKSYYSMKSKVISVDGKTIMTNENTVDLIQQIGRVCVREEKTPNVYYFGVGNEDAYEELGNVYKITKQTYDAEHFNEINCATGSKQKSTKYLIKIMLNELDIGETLPKADIFEQLLPDKAKGTIRNALASSDIVEFMEEIGIDYNSYSEMYIRRKKRGKK